MRIGELAGRAGVSTKAIRYYEEIGLLPEPERAPNGYRTYSERAVERLGFIKDAQASGLSLTEIAAILELRESGESTCRHVIGLLEEHLATLDAQIAALRSMRRKLRELTDRAKSLDPAACTDPDRCQTITGADELLPPETSGRIHGGPVAHRHTSR